ncbi:MAG: hypothetical protein ACI8ZX_002022 [Planctomycetota bacterium]|jgi:hypothetical protein
MKKILLTLFIIAGLTQTTQGQVGCDDMNLIVNVSYEDYVNIYHPGHYLTSPGEDNFITWTITDNQDNIVTQETLNDEAIFAFNHNIPTTETMNVSATLINETAEVACLIQDVLFWEETEVIPGVFVYSWAFLYGNTGTVLGTTDNQLVDFEITATLIDTYLELRSTENLKITLYDKTGRSVKKRKIATPTTRVPMDDIPSGIYFLQLSNDKNNSQTIKLIKK